jgi:hypothetical protein
MKIETLQHHWDSIEKNTLRGMSPEFKKALQESFFTGAVLVQFENFHLQFSNSM